MGETYELARANIFTGDGFRVGSIRFSDCVDRLLFEDEDEGNGGGGGHQGDSDPTLPLLIPGMVELHSHGALLADFSDGVPDGNAAILSYYARNGITAALGTTMTYPKAHILRAMDALRPHVGQRPGGGARLLGVNMEGPFLAAGKRGAHLEDCLLAPSLAFFEEAMETSGDAIRLVSLAPELEGAEG
ncbi:MAG: hypothetical protein LBD12_07925, partial [Clostridiales Family XIII bacterium]|nr:hypothetical protein [Clostridiales Family XIII bacterium]